MGSATYTVHRNAQRHKQSEEAMAAGEAADEQRG
jgi:hypothetical protein